MSNHKGHTIEVRKVFGSLKAYCHNCSDYIDNWPFAAIYGLSNEQVIDLFVTLPSTFNKDASDVAVVLDGEEVTPDNYYDCLGMVRRTFSGYFN